MDMITCETFGDKGRKTRGGGAIKSKHEMEMQKSRRMGSGNRCGDRQWIIIDDIYKKKVKQNKYWSLLWKDGGELTVSLDLESRSMERIDLTELNIPKGTVGTKPEENGCIQSNDTLEN